MSSLNFATLYTPGFWSIVLAPKALASGIPIQYLVSGITEESGGNPCAIGRPDQYGPDGQPREVGIWQFYNPDDLNYLKVSGASLRAYCNPKKVKYTLHDANGKPYSVDGPSQEVARGLTSEEIIQQADMTIAKVSRDRQYAQIALANAGATWPQTGEHAIDFWRAVKLVHGLPGILTSGMPAFKAKTGHAPASWREWRHAIETGEVSCDPNTERYRSRFGPIFDNAERATSSIPGSPLA